MADSGEGMRVNAPPQFLAAANVTPQDDSVRFAAAALHHAAPQFSAAVPKPKLNHQPLRPPTPIFQPAAPPSANAPATGGSGVSMNGPSTGSGIGDAGGIQVEYRTRTPFS